MNATEARDLIERLRETDRRPRIVPASGLRVERRAEGGPPRILGHASVFDQWTTLYSGAYFEMREIVRPGAYTRAIAEKQDVRALFNHDANWVLGRTRAGTLALSQDQVGLWTETDAPDTQAVRDQVLAPIERGDLSGMSFAFTVREAERPIIASNAGVIVIQNGGERITIRVEGQKEIQERELLDLDLHDISPVTWPAYEGTDVSIRSLAERRDRPHTPPRRDPWLDRAHVRLRLAEADLR